jgi:hypothetical protein
LIKKTLTETLTQNNLFSTLKRYKYDTEEIIELKKASKFENYDPEKIRLLTKDVKLSKWSASSFLKTWHHTPISRAGKVKTTLYKECCDGDCDMGEILESGIQKDCCEGRVYFIKKNCINCLK